MARKISDNPTFVMPLCPSAEHYTPPVQERIATGATSTRVDGWAEGQYEHVCPDCGNVTLFGVFDLTGGQKDYREFSGVILGGVSSTMSESDALDFLHRQAVARSGQ